MADLEQALDRLLGDPAAMAQIMDLAGKLNAPATDADSASPEAPAPEEPPPKEAPLEETLSPSPAPDLDGLAPLLTLLGSGGGDPQADDLLRALRPYLSESRRRKLDKAVRLASVARTAKTALEMWKEGKLSV